MILPRNVYLHMLTDSLFSLLKVIVQCLYAFHVALWQQCVMMMRCHCVFVGYYACQFRQMDDCKIYMYLKHFIITFIKSIKNMNIFE